MSSYQQGVDNDEENPITPKTATAEKDALIHKKETETVDFQSV